MKKFIILSMFSLFLVFAGNSASAQNQNSVENKVRAAAVHCAQPYMTPHADIYPSLISEGRCINGGTVYMYDVWVVYSCPPNLVPACLTLAPVKVATVTTDCNGKIDTVTCY